MSSPEEQIAAVLTAHERYEWWPMTREFICICETSLGRSYPDPAHKNHIASALAAAGIGVVADARAAALRDAATDLFDESPGWRHFLSGWLSDRADRIEAESTP